MTTTARSSRLITTTFATLAAALMLLSGCGSDASTPKATKSPDTSTTTTASQTATDLRGERYCEVLLLRPATPGFTADVYNSYPMNDCPEAEWKALDAGSLATANGVPIARLNGPRYWLMDEIEKMAGETTTVDFGGIEMAKRATVAVPDVVKANTPYTPNHVNRKTVFGFDAGSTVYELTGPDGAKYVMQSWSQQGDPALVEADLAGLAARLQLPAGWSYAPRTLTARLQVVTTTEDAVVIQDDLHNTYSRETS